MHQRLPPAPVIVLSQRRIFIMPTTLGMVYLLLLAALFLGGINFANNLLLGLCFFLSALGVVTILRTFHNLDGLEIRSLHGEPGEAGRTVIWHLSIHHHPLRWHWQIQLHCLGDIKVQEVGPDVSWEVDWTLPAVQRGILRTPRLKIVTEWPLGLLQAWSWLDLDTRIAVWPRPVAGPWPEEGPVHRELEEGLPSVSTRTPTGIDEFDRMEPYRTGYPLSRVAWRQVARNGQWWVQQWTDSVPTHRLISFSAFPGVPREVVLERMAAQMLSETGCFSVELPGSLLGPGQGPEFIRGCLLALAHFEAPEYRLETGSGNSLKVVVLGDSPRLV